MPLEIKKTVQQMVDEANSQIETLPLAEAMKIAWPARRHLHRHPRHRANCGATARSPVRST